MSDAVIVAIISSGVTLIGVIISGVASAKKSDAAFRTSQAVMETRMDELTREVREHNNYARRMPVVEEKIESLCLRVTKLENQNKSN